MGSLALLQSLKESVLGDANVKAIYGDPISAHEKTIIPVAKITYGFGGAQAPEASAKRNTRGEGGGGAGGVRAVPIGVIEVEQAADSVRSDYGPAKADRSGSGRNGGGNVLGLAQASLTMRERSA